MLVERSQCDSFERSDPLNTQVELKWQCKIWSFSMIQNKASFYNKWGHEFKEEVDWAYSRFQVFFSNNCFIIF